MYGPPILLMPDRRRDLFDVHLVAFEHVVQQRPAVDGLRRFGWRALEVIAPPLNLLHLRGLRRQAERQVTRGIDVRMLAMTR